jgi:WD40 repeat protein
LAIARRRWTLAGGALRLGSPGRGRRLVIGGVRLRAALSDDGGKLAVPGTVAGREVIRIWDLDSATDTSLGVDGVLQPTATNNGIVLDFTPDGGLLAADGSTLTRWNLESGEHVVLGEAVGEFGANRDDSILVSRVAMDGSVDDRAAVRNLRTGDEILLDSHGIGVLAVALDPTGQVVVTAGRDGFVRVGKATGEPPHHIMSNQNGVLALAVSPDGRWIASGGADGSVRIWPMPDVEEPPLLTLPAREFLASLKERTNLRVVGVVGGEPPGRAVRAVGDSLTWE